MDDSLKELEALKAENERLKAKNDKLYKDCVTFAKKIKAHEEVDARLAKLEEENASLKAEVEKLSSDEVIPEPAPSKHKITVKAKAKEPVVIEPIDESDFEKEVEVEEEAVEEENVFNELKDIVEETEEIVDDIVEIESPEETVSTGNFFDDHPEDFNFDQSAFASSLESDNSAYDTLTSPEVDYDDEEPQEVIIPKNHSTYKKSPFRTFIRVLLSILLTFSLIIGIGSSLTYLFCTAYEDYGIANYRFAVIRNNSLSPTIKTDDIVLVKYSNFNGIEINSPVLTTKDERSVGLITSVDIKDGVSIATIKDKNGTYTVTEDQFYGQIIFTIPELGKVVAYASANPFNYLAIIVSANLILIALLLIIPSNKSKKPKFGKDYDVEDFTI